MIIECPRCGRRYRVSDELADKPDARFRCGGCKYVFTRPATPEPDAGGEIPVPRDIPLGQDEDLRNLSKLLDDIDSGSADVQRTTTGEEPAADETRPEEPAGTPTAEPRPDGKERRRTGGWLLFLVLCIVIVLGALALRLNSSVRTAVTTGFSRTFAVVESLVGSHDDRDLLHEARQNIELTDVEEAVHSNWIAGKILIVTGIAVNKNDFSLSSLRVKGKLMDENRNVIAETESCCGNLLSEEELRNLTRKEIERELLMPTGRDRRGVTIPPGGPVPFMLAFVNPENTAGLFAVEVIDAGVPGADEEDR